jgi:hypothetical protein
MRKRQALLWAGVVVLAAGGGVWLVSMASRQTPLPKVGVPKSEALDPDAPGPVFVEYVAPAPGTTLNDLVAEADAVLTVMLRTNRVDRVETGAPPSHGMTYSIYDFTVREVVKGAFRSGDSVKIARIGGRGSYEPEFPRPGLGEEFLVLLRAFPEVDGFRHLYGRVAFRVVDGELQSMGQMYREMTGRRVQDVLRELRGRATHTKD